MSNKFEQFNQTKCLIEKYILSRNSEKAARRPINLEKMPLPKFDGIIRNYPQFKRDFNELVLINIDSKEAAFTLRNCVSTDVRDYLGCCNDDVTEMFERLDIKYGDPCKIMESIVSQIHKFKRLDADDPKRIIQFVDMLEKAHRDLNTAPPVFLLAISILGHSHNYKYHDTQNKLTVAEGSRTRWGGSTWTWNLLMEIII